MRSWHAIAVAPLAGLLFLVWSTAARAQWQVATKPIVDIAASSGDTVRFGNATGATLLRNGVVAIADNVDGAIHFLDASGRRLRTVGRRGSGPGEFQLISWLGNCGADSLYVWDFGLRRMTVLDGAGGIVTQYTLPLRAADGAAPYVLACSRAGSIAMLQSPARLPTPRQGVLGARGTARLLTIDPRGRLEWVLGEVATHEYSIDRSGAVLPRPLGMSTYIAVSDKHVFVGTGDSAAINVLTPGSSERRTIALRVKRRQATSRHLAAAISELVAYANDRAVRGRMEELLREIPPPSHLPPYSGLFTDTAGLVWAVVSTPGDATTRIEVYSPSGALLSLVELPVPLHVFEVGSSHVLGRYELPSGEQRVAAFRVHRPPVAGRRRAMTGSD